VITVLVEFCAGLDAVVEVEPMDFSSVPYPGSIVISDGRRWRVESVIYQDGKTARVRVWPTVPGVPPPV